MASNRESPPEASSVTFEERSIRMNQDLIDAVDNYLSDAGNSFEARVRFAIREHVQREILRESTPSETSK